ncbi:MAG: XRE family transcriptional regulator [Alphaproteobacteria bacterium]|nr:XRE family transcriptional regulator [Alphaproteobacteria bacterium]
MLTAQQVRAARALINWSQKELAQKSGISLNAINNFEREIVAPRQDTLLALRRTLEEAGLEFIGDSGVNKARDQLRMEQHDGNFMKVLIDDMILVARSGIKTFWLHGIDPTEFAPESLEKWWQAKQGTDIDERVLLSYGNFNFASRDPIYRWVSREMLGEVPFVAYGGNLAILLGNPATRLVIMRSRPIAKTFEDQFIIHWSGAKEPSPEQHMRGWEEFHNRDWSEAA